MPPRVRWSSVAGRLPLPVACARALCFKDIGLAGGGARHAARSSARLRCIAQTHQGAPAIRSSNACTQVELRKLTRFS
eukprot:COSAG02_NODE_131_length_34710_cov_17.171159_11_plen_78_part_00